MAYVSMCIKDIGDFKQGMFFTTYHQSDNIGDIVSVAKIDEQGNVQAAKYTSFRFNDFRNHFAHVNQWYGIKYLEEDDTLSNKIKKFFKNTNLETYQRQRFVNIKFDMPTLQQVYSKVLIYLLLLEDDECLYSVSDIITNTLESLSEMYKYKDLGVINFLEEIDKAAEVCKQVYLLIKPMQDTIKKNENDLIISKLKEYAPMHNAMIKANIDFLKELNKYN